MFKIYYYFTICLVCFILFKYFKKKLENYFKTDKTVYKLDESEINKEINYNLFKPDEVTYLFWSGGYNSTFRLCQLLLIEEKPVQTIYIFNDSIQMKNEIKAMKNIRKKILTNYPILKQKFLPTRYITNIKENKDITKKYNILHNNYGYFDKTRSSFNINEKIIRYSLECDYYIEICINKEDTEINRLFKINDNKFSNLDSNIEDYNFNYHKKIKKETNPKEIEIYKNLVFPIIMFDKKTLNKYSIINIFNFILQLSWSCESNESKCNRCYKCITSPIFIP